MTCQRKKRIGKRGIACAFFLTGIGFFFALPVWAQAVPPHLASFSATLFHQLEQELADPSGSAEERQAIETTRAALRKTGMANWSQQPVVQNGALEGLATPLGLDVKNKNDLALLNRLIREDSAEDRRKRIAAILKDKGRNTDETALNKALEVFDSARAEVFKDKPLMHSMKLGETGILEMLWRPEENRVEMLVSGRLDDSSDGKEYQTLLSGTVTPEAAAHGGGVALDVDADKNGLQAYAGESLERLRASIFGVWNGPDGQVWKIAKADGSIPEPETETVPDHQAEIDNKRKEIEDLKNQKAFVWKNSKTGKIKHQKKFERLSDPFVYEGEIYGSPEGAARLQALEAELVALETQARKKLPVDEHDPINIKAVADEAQILQITVTQADGYSYTYRSAYFDSYTIKADRTLTNRKDIIDLPDDVIGQLVASWSPPEWINLQVRPDEQGAVRLDGTWWRLNVTYSGGFFGMGGNTVESIHTPYSKPLALRSTIQRPEQKTADGAAEDELL